MENGYSIVLYDYDSEQMFMAYFKDMDSLIDNCERNDRDPSDCFVFKGKLEVVPMLKHESSEKESDEDCDDDGDALDEECWYDVGYDY